MLINSICFGKRHYSTVYNFTIFNLHKCIFIHFVVLVTVFFAVMSYIALVDAPVKIVMSSKCFSNRLFCFHIRNDSWFSASSVVASSAATGCSDSAAGCWASAAGSFVDAVASDLRLFSHSFRLLLFSVWVNNIVFVHDIFRFFYTGWQNYDFSMLLFMIFCISVL